MTKVQITIPLYRTLTDSDLPRIAHLHSVIGFNAVRVKPSGDALFIEYDASRLSPDEVRGALAGSGIPIGRPAALAQEEPRPEDPAAV